MAYRSLSSSLSLSGLTFSCSLFSAVLSGALSGCSGIDGGDGGNTGGASSGGAASGGAPGSGGQASGGQGSGGAGSGGDNTGGAPGSGGSSSGGAGTGGGNTGGGDGSGGGGNPDFQPCPATGPCKILPLGDSITFGLGYDGGYRVNLFSLALADDHEITFTGTQSPNGPTMVDAVAFPRNHAGISGQTISQIAGRIPTPDFGDPAQIILVHAGTNDIYQSGWEQAPMRLGALMDKLIDEAPDALLVFSNIIPFPQQAQRVMTFNSTVEGMVDERAAAGAHIIFVDQFTDFPTSELGDGVHPNKAGYDRMASKWYEAIESYLP